MNKYIEWLKVEWRRVVFWLIGAVVLILVCFFNLEGITNSELSQPEINAINSSSSLAIIADNPLFLPFKISQLLAIKLSGGSIFILRAISALFGASFAILFYLLARYWFSPRIAWFTTLMLLTNGLFLNYARLAVPDILLPLSLLCLLASAWWIYKSRRPNLALFTTGLVLASSLYIPGMIWFGGIALAAQYRHVVKIISKLTLWPSIGFFALLITLLTPLLRSFVIRPSLISDWLALPSRFDAIELIKQFVFVPMSLVVRSLPDPVFNLGHLPYLDILTLCLAVLGSYAYLMRLKLIRTRALIAATAIAWVLVSFNNSVRIVIILPLVYLTVAAGIMFILQQWYVVFPRNPIVRTAGMLLLLTVISISVFYNGTRYFQAWAHSPVTRQAFQESLPANLVQ